MNARGALLTATDLATYAAVAREPVRAHYRGRDVLTNPPPSAGGILVAHALASLQGEPSPPSTAALLAAMEAAQAARSPEFLEALDDPDVLERFATGGLGSTTHISAIDADGLACAVTCSNGEGCGIVVPGTGMHLNNMLGEQDLNPFGFHRHPPGRRLPSMMAPTVVLAADGRSPEIALGSGGSNRIRSAILQTICNVLDRSMSLSDAVQAPRIHVEEDVVYVEPGYDAEIPVPSGHELVHFQRRNLFFGGVHAVRRDPVSGALEGAGDPRRGGAVALA